MPRGLHKCLWRCVAVTRMLHQQVQHVSGSSVTLQGVSGESSQPDGHISRPRQCRLQADSPQNGLQAARLVPIDTGLPSGLQAVQELSQRHAAELEVQLQQAGQAALGQEGRMHTLLAEARQQAQADSWCAAMPLAVQCPWTSCLSALLAQEHMSLWQRHHWPHMLTMFGRTDRCLISKAAPSFCNAPSLGCWC